MSDTGSGRKPARQKPARSKARRTEARQEGVKSPPQGDQKPAGKRSEARHGKSEGRQMMMRYNFIPV